MKKRIVAYGSVLIVIFAAVCIYLYASTFYPGVSMGNYLCIRAGDHVSEVEKRLSGPREGPDGPDWRSGTPVLYDNQGWIEGWEGSIITITIIYDRDSRVIAASQNLTRHRRSWLREKMDWLMNIQEVRE